MTIALSDAKARFSEVVRSVRHTGKPVIVTVDGEAAVEIRPAPAPGPPLSRQDVATFEALLAALPRLWTSSEPFDAVSAVADVRR